MIFAFLMGIALKKVTVVGWEMSKKHFFE